jgi:hypothetical protein
LIDYFAIGLTHGLLALACLRLVMRADLDGEGGEKATKRPKPWLKAHAGTEEEPGDA